MIEQLLLRTTSRRGFMWGTLVSGIGLLAAGCSGNSPSSPREVQLPSPESRVSIKEVTSTLTKAEVRSLLEQLNPSPYKDFIMRYAYPLYQNNPPESIILAGEEIMVSDSRVIDKEEKGVMQGRASLRITQKGKRFRLQQAVETCIDIATHIIVQVNAPQKETAKDAFLYLGERGIINKDLSERMGKAADFRNRVVHGYDLREFGAQVLKYLESSP